MMKSFLLSFLLIMMAACSGDDNTTINIEAPSNNGGSNGGDSGGGESGGGDSGGGSSATCPEATSEVREGLCELPATISADMTLSAGLSYLMSDRVTVGNGNGQLEVNDDGTLDDGSAVQAVTLTIEAG